MAPGRAAPAPAKDAPLQRAWLAPVGAHFFKSGADNPSVDKWQSPNGFDILGIVIYRLVEEASPAKLEAMPLDFIRLSKSHTGEYLANTVRLVAEKFGIQDKICGLVTDNAKNNELMVRELKKLKWPCFKGEAQWIRCFAHILNLIVQAILRPFGTPKKKGATKNPGSNSDGIDSDEDLAEEQISMLPRGHKPTLQDEESLHNLSDVDSNSESDEDKTESLSEADIKQASEEDKEDCYTSESCKQTLAKFRVIAKKLRFSPNSKAEFVEICQEKVCATPHNIERDVRTQWNSTSAQLNSIIRCEDAIVNRAYQLDEGDFKLARDLVEVLNVFYKITLQLSVAGSARLSNIVLYIDQITEHLSTVISNENYPAALRNTCRLGLKVTNKDEYFKLANWEPEWISKAIRLARDMWILFYKPKPITLSSPAPAPNTTSSSKVKTLDISLLSTKTEAVFIHFSQPKTGMLAGLGHTAAARGGDFSSDPFDLWLAGGLVLNGTVWNCSASE
ncbi:uncharacterized protein PGTG_04103 [Puccinia graminis f. sp. tritici CRL 75-36-700-3]|uniref:DUF659 domain-containing protein n=1 Tax=Puccinia graminis f. sp. tritici (strain CRL 75-36-700-3 / race SCCL) TaxID=418459 RepID=E3K1H2_PUCGT|nr:uncharacterized protein PGTG_04103 [Puccinia graminis f. sp. tritici CRL 75-36-700-3]EFP78147.2 hypothetical protein PGTG_04103 [Puccinia graminis f. sp. tritici CRL 75-36-700-3]